MTELLLAVAMLPGVYNSPFPDRFTVIPELDLEHTFSSGLYLRQTASARTTPEHPLRMNPITARWISEVGWKRGAWRFTLGHQSEHSVASSRFERVTESANYVRIEFRLK